MERPALWLVRPLRIEAVRKEASTMEVETRRFYEKAAARTQDASIRQLLDDLATEEREHEERAQELDKQKLPDNVKADEEVAQRRLFVLQIVQPGLAGLMDGSVSTLAPVFAAAFATQKSWDAFLVGLAASAGAGISMGFAEALSDDGSLTGRGHPWVRGVDLRRHDGSGRNRSHAAVSDSRFPRGSVGRRRGGAGRAGRDYMDPQALHGYALGYCGSPGRARRRAGIHHRRSDRKFLGQLRIVNLRSPISVEEFVIAGLSICNPESEVVLLLMHGYVFMPAKMPMMSNVSAPA